MQDNHDDEAAKPRFRPVPWTALETPAEVELWIAEHDLALREHVGPHERGHGVCFSLAEGGEVYMQASDGAVILDVTPDAEWVTPLLCAVAGSEPPRGRLWVLPDDKLVQLILGLSTLVATTTLVVGHHFGRRHV